MIERQAWPKKQPPRPRPRKVGMKATRRLLWTRSGGLCERCGRPAESVHHRVKEGQGGRWCGSNCVEACGDGTRGCHGWAEHEPNAAHAEGWHVRWWENPAKVPINTIHGRVRLADDGSMTPAPKDEDEDDGSMSPEGAS